MIFVYLNAQIIQDRNLQTHQSLIQDKILIDSET